MQDYNTLEGVLNIFLFLKVVNWCKYNVFLRGNSIETRVVNCMGDNDRKVLVMTD